MIGTTLEDIRTHVEELASESGEYALVCARYGECPVPATGLRFESRETARSAARATEQYRATLRQYDPRLPCYDVIVRQDPVSSGRTIPTASQPTNADGESGDWTLSEPVVGRQTVDQRDRIEFCHRVAAAVFETLSVNGYDTLETAIIDAYLDVVEAYADPDDLCLCLLETMAMELDQWLPPREQADVLASAAVRLPSIDPVDQPVAATFSALESRGLLGSYTQSAGSVDRDSDTRAVDVRLSGYEMSPQDDRLPVLPIVLELHRRRPDWIPTSIRVVDVDDGWRVTLVRAGATAPNSLASAPIQSERSSDE